MTIYAVRDYQMQYTTSFHGDVAQWLLALFMKNILGYTVVGSTGFTTNFTALASGTVSPNLAGINFGATGGPGGIPAYFEVSVPVGVYVVSVSDVGRVLVLKSTANPTFNSGIFVIQGIDATNNRFVIDYRTADPGSVSFPPPEAGGTSGMLWWLYNNDSTCPQTRGTNAGTGYRGNGTSTDSRIIFQSPHATAWQVRLCSENSTDFGNFGPCNSNTVAPGFAGNGSGDFPTGANGGKHLHGALFWDTLNSNQGADPNRSWAMGYSGGSSTLMRITIVGDDGGQAVAIFLRHLNGTTSPNPSFCVFGLPDNEPGPLPSDNTRRLFVLGYVSNANSGNNQNINWVSGRNDGGWLIGNAFGSLGIPISCTPGLWSNIEGGAQNTSAIYDATAGDNGFLSGSELTEVDIWVGCQQTFSSTFNYAFTLEPRFIGTIPLIRAGRANFTQYSTTTDASRAWYHFINGVYMTYNGPNPVP